jgi:hypothetical protein
MPGMVTVKKTKDKKPKMMGGGMMYKKGGKTKEKNEKEKT